MTDLPHPLHWTQRFFWFSAATAMLLGAVAFSWAVWSGRQASIELFGVKIASDRAEFHIDKVKQQLAEAQAELSIAIQSQDLGKAQKAAEHMQDALVQLGFARKSLKIQQATLSHIQDKPFDYTPSYTYWDYPDETLNTNAIHNIPSR